MISCTSPHPKEALAQYQKTYLMRWEISIPPNLSHNDSIAWMQMQIRNWIREMALAETTLKSFPDIEKEIAPQIAQYRRRLLIAHLWKNLGQNFSLALQESTLREYYAKHLEDFLALEAYYKIRYVRFPTSHKNHLEATQKISLSHEDFLSWCKQNRYTCIADTTWWESSRLDSLRQSTGIPLPTEKLGVYSFIDQPLGTSHLFALRALVRPGEILPYALARPLIYQRLASEKKEAFLQAWEDSLYQKVIRRADVRIF
ncbi:MAG: hypothetical protein ACUVRD_03080 [Bacteroidia bacterium]